MTEDTESLILASLNAGYDSSNQIQQSAASILQLELCSGRDLKCPCIIAETALDVIRYGFDRGVHVH